MTVYMVERELKGVSMEQLGAAQKAAIAKAGEMTKAGRPVSYLRTTFVPSEGCCMCLFEAGSASDVEKLNKDAGIPFSRVVEALDLRP